LISTTGVDGGDPTPVAAVIADHCGSQNLVVGILAALHHRHRSGRGQQIEASLLGGQIWAQASEYTYYLLSGRVPGRANRRNPMIASALYGIFETADGWIGLVGVPPTLWRGFCRAIDRDDLSADPRFLSLFQKAEDQVELRRIAEETFRTRSTAEWCQRLKAEKQRFAPVNTYIDVVADEQAWANGYFAKAEHPDWGEITTVGFPIRFSETPASPGVAAPELGQHTEEVLLEAGFTWEELEELRAAGAW
jgi:formyl-CoA transferase/CoA:oxalate CoA-transferase